METERERTASWFEEHGWGQGGVNHGTCLVNGIREANSSLTSFLAREALWGVLEKELVSLNIPFAESYNQSEPGGLLVEWNDAEGRTQEQVLKLLRGTLTREDLDA
jgi:hypothetical protein